MTEKRCYTCIYFEFQGDCYHSVEHCKLHNISQKHPLEHLDVCDDWTKSRYAGLKKVVAILKGLW